jgi:cell division protein FtsB
MNFVLFSFRLLKNKFAIASIFFVVWMLFFDNNNWFYLKSLTDQANQKKKDIDWYQQETKKISKEYQDMSTSMDAMEKYARENYYMKKDNEDIFVIVPEPEKN